jgi:hypothetical protein
VAEVAQRVLRITRRRYPTRIAHFNQSPCWLCTSQFHTKSEPKATDISGSAQPANHFRWAAVLGYAWLCRRKASVPRVRLLDAGGLVCPFGGRFGSKGRQRHGRRSLRLGQSGCIPPLVSGEICDLLWTKGPVTATGPGSSAGAARRAETLPQRTGSCWVSSGCALPFDPRRGRRDTVCAVCPGHAQRSQDQLGRDSHWGNGVCFK